MLKDYSKTIKKIIFFKSVTKFSLVVLFLFLGNQLFSQIIVESGTAQVDFGTDADVQAGITEYIYDTFGVLMDNDLFPDSDDWFENGNTGGSPARGVIDVSGVGPSGNNPYLSGMSKAAFSQIDGYLWLDGVYIRDPNWAGNNKDFSIFKGGSNKNADNPATWNIITGSNPQKNDLIDIFGHLRRDGLTIQDDLWVFIGASTRSADGSSYLDVELYRSEMIYDPNTNTLSGLGPDGGHTAWEFDDNPSWVTTQLGDVIIALNFENGGTNIIGHIYAWVKPSDLPGGSIIAANALIPGSFEFKFAIGGNGQPIFESGDGANGWGYAEIELNGAGPTVAFASINADDVQAGPWGTLFGPQASQTDVYSQESFVELGLNLTAIGLDQSTVDGEDCGALFGGVLIKTRSSASFDSELKDLAGPFPLGDREEVTAEIEGENVEWNTDPNDRAMLTAVTGTPCGGCTFAWYDEDPGDPVDPNIVPIGTEMTLEVTEEGTYWVVVTAPGINGPGCTSQDSFEVGTITPDPIILTCPTGVDVDCNTSDIPGDFDAWINGFGTSGGQGVITETYTATIDGVPVNNGDPINLNDLVAPTVTCDGTIIVVTLDATDECEQDPEPCSSTFTLLPDNEAPTLVGTIPDGGTDLNLCFSDIPAGPTEAEIAALYTDNCGNVNVTKTGTPTGDDCDWTVTYNYTIEDDCENFADEVNITYSGGDTEDPEIINLPVVDDLCNDDFPEELFADWTDNCADGGTISSGAPVINDFFI